MATNVSYPGVYIEEVPSGVRTIAGVPTSVAAFVGYTRRGPTNSPQQIFSYADFERGFGGLDADSELSYSVSHFFLNGGATAWIVRVAAGAAAAAIGLEDSVDGGANLVLTATARGQGAWGNLVRVFVDYDTANPASLFNLTVIEFQDRGGQQQPARSETFRNLSMDSNSPAYAVDTVNAGSNLITLTRPAGLTFSTAGTSVSGAIDATALAKLGDGARTLAISIDGGRVYEFDFMNAGDALTGGTFKLNMKNLADRIKAAVQALEPGNTAFANFNCVETATTTSGFLTCTAGNAGANREKSAVTVRAASRRNAASILSIGIQAGGREVSGSAARRPARSGTAWPRNATLDFTTLDSPAKMDIDLLDAAGNVVNNQNIAVWTLAGDRPVDLSGLAGLIEKALGTVSRPEFKGASVSVVDGQIVFVPGGATPGVRFKFNKGPTAAVATLDLSTGAQANVAAYQLGIGPAVAAQTGPAPGNDGTPPTAIDIEGSRLAKTGIYALEDVDLFNLLVLPGQSDPALQAAAVAYAEQRRSFVLLDLPDTIDTLPEATAWLGANGALRHRNAATYFPRIRMADSLQQNRVRAFANSGAVAGLYARTDASRGVWKAPAGTDAGLRGVRGLDYVLTDGENGVINPLGLNALRQFPAYGPIAWGARTMVGSDALASEWKYVPVRRLSLFLEESLYRGTQWVVFEPNDEPLWAQIRLNVGAFMHTLFRQGAFQGASPRDAYLVQCDSTTTTQDDINLGIVNIVVGFAPLKPAEFVIIKLQQLAGQAGAGA